MGQIENMINRFKAIYIQSDDAAFNFLDKALREYTQGKCHDILVLSGKKTCDAGYFVKMCKSKGFFK